MTAIGFPMPIVHPTRLLHSILRYLTILKWEILIEVNLNSIGQIHCLLRSLFFN